MQLSRQRTQPPQYLHNNRLDPDFVEHVKQVSDPSMILGTLGVSFERIDGNYARTCCPVHGGDNPTSFSINLITGTWKCFSHGCHEGQGGLINLVMILKRCTYVQAIKYMASVMNINEHGDYREEVARALNKRDIDTFVQKEEKSKIKLCTIDNIEEQIPIWMQNRVDYFLKKGYSNGIHDYFEIGFQYDVFNIPRATFPIRDDQGRVVAYDGRRIDSDEEPRYHVQPRGFPKSLVLYHYHKIKDLLSYYNGILFVVEGYKACWSVVQTGILNVVAAMGAGLMGEQPAILQKNMDVKKIVLALDGDVAGRNGTSRTVRELGYAFDIDVIEFPDGEDPSTLEPSYLYNTLIKHM